MEIKEIKHLAELSKLEFTEEEFESFKKDFDSLIRLADTIKNANIVGGRKLKIIDMNDLREDVAKESSPTEILLQNAPQKNENYFIVPRIME